MSELSVDGGRRTGGLGLVVSRDAVCDADHPDLQVCVVTPH